MTLELARCRFARQHDGRGSGRRVGWCREGLHHHSYACPVALNYAQACDRSYLAVHNSGKRTTVKWIVLP